MTLFDLLTSTVGQDVTNVRYLLIRYTGVLNKHNICEYAGIIYVSVDII